MMLQYKSAPFKIYDRYRWTVIVSNREHIEEVLRAPDDELSFAEATNDVRNRLVLLDYTCADCSLTAT